MNELGGYIDWALLLACLTDGLIAVEGVFFLFSLIPPIVFVFLLVPYTPFFQFIFYSSFIHLVHWVLVFGT
jgi:hypothetical protein